MKNYQDAVLEEFEKIANKLGFETTISHSYSNQGILRAGGYITSTKAWLSFHFQRNHNRITFNTDSMSPAGFIWSETNGDETLTAMYARWTELLTEE